MVKNKLPKLTEDQLYDYAKGLAGMVFRNGVVEDLHAQNAELDDDAMNIINHDVCNRLYAIIKMLTSGDLKQLKILDCMLTWNRNMCRHWDNPTIPEDFQWTDDMLEFASHDEWFGGKED